MSYNSRQSVSDVWQDLSHYEYDMMIVKSMALLNRFYSTHDNLFKHAVQAQVGGSTVQTRCTGSGRGQHRSNTLYRLR